MFDICFHVVTHITYLISDVSYANRTFWYNGSAGHEGGAWYRGEGRGTYIYIYMYIVRELPPQQVPGRPCFETFLELGAGVVLYMFFGE